MTPYEELATRCEQAEGPGRELDGLIEIAVTFKGNSGYQHVKGKFYANDRRIIPVHEAPAYTASIDAALTLMLPERGGLWWDNARAAAWMNGGRRCYASTPALAICAAALRARGAKP